MDVNGLNGDMHLGILTVYETVLQKAGNTAGRYGYKD